MSDTANAREIIHLGLLDDADHEAKMDTDAEYRKTELRIQALGAAISRRDWHATEQAYGAIRDKFNSTRPIAPPAGKEAVDEAARAFYRKVWERAIEPPPAWELLPEDNADKVFCREYAVHVLAAIRVPLIQQGLREAAEIARNRYKDWKDDETTPVCDDFSACADIAAAIEARADAMGKGEE